MACRPARKESTEIRLYPWKISVTGTSFLFGGLAFLKIVCTNTEYA